MAAQSPTENTLPNWKRCNKPPSEPPKAEQDKKSTQFKVSETAKPILEEQALLKEKLKSQLTWKKDKDSGSLRRKAQPMVARPPLPGAPQKQALPQQSQQSSSSSSKPPSPPPTRRRTNSPSSSFNAGTSRSSSPLAEISPEFKRNIEKATRARLYLLQQVGPNSFMIGGDSPNHKFKVIIGPQTCSCGKPFCVHLLFVMLRVFKVTENDPLLWNNNLRNYEVEGLFSKFHARVNSRLAKNTNSRIRGPLRSQNRRTPPPSPSGSIVSSSEPSSSSINKDDEEVCPICLLEMVEGESLTCCKGGCNNRLHQHCMEIWAVECKTRKERLNCPLCRRILTPDAAPFLGDRSPKGSPLSPSRNVSPNVPTPLGPEEVITLPHSEPIPSQQIELARPWIQVLGEDIVSCMFSREWTTRETALRRLSKDLDSILINSEDRTTSMTSLEACCSLLSMMCGDPVYKVYVAALRTLRVMLGLTRYTSDEDKVSLQALLRPVIETIMSKCSDGNRRISALSIKVLIEICKDQNGDLALGRMLGQNQHQSLGGLGFMLTCILTTAHEYATWPWWLGRLYFLHRLLEEYIDLFKLQPESPEISLDNSVGVIVQEGDHIDGNEIYSDNMTRLMSVLRFAILAGQCSHTMVSKQAITILLCCTSLSASCPSAFVHIKKLVSKLKPSQRSILQRRLATLSRTTSVETSDGDSSPLSEVSAAILDSDIDESVVSESSSGYFSTRRIESTSTADESENPSEVEFIQSLVESLKRPNFLCLNLPRNVTSPTRDLDLLDWSRSEGESPRLPGVVVDNKCQKKIEEEENEAVARAMAVSVQERGPQTIPSLRPSIDEDEMVIVYTQPESMEKAVNTKHLYMENIHWKKGDLLGTGAFSSCYAARDVFSGSLMAVKQVSFCRNSKCEQEKVCQSIMDEITLLGKLQHPHLIKCLGATKHAGHFNIFLEWMAGGSISMLLSKYGAFEQATLIRYTRQILQGVAHLHQNQVIHRDIKGANILVDSTGQHIRIADFGAAARLATQITGAGEFQGQLLGTIAFMAPEVLRGESYGRSCDVWSVGCLLIEMATGKPPWNAHEHSNHLALIFKIACATSPPEIPDSLNPAIRDVLLRCFEQKPEDRPPAMELLKHPLFTQVTQS